jgi:putative ABC transport system ATP-binding protein
VVPWTPPPAEPTGAPLFSFEHVTVHGDGADRLHNLSFEVADDGITTVTGPSGSGKSTLLRLCNRLVVADGGVVRLRGVDVASIDPLALRRTVGLVLQRPVAFAGTVAENLREARPFDGSVGALGATLERVGLDAALLDRPADELSGGELQRVCLARTLLTEPTVLLLDEPTSSLDEQSAERVERTICELVRGGLRALWVTHDAAQARRVGVRNVALAAGGRLAGVGAP